VAALKLLFGSKASAGNAVTFLCFWGGLNGIQINLYNFAQHQFGWSKVQSVKLQAMSGLLLALSNAAGPSQLLPRLGEKNTVRLGMLGMAASLACAAGAKEESTFFAAICGASLATVCLPVLIARLSACVGKGEGGAALSALETANTLNRVAAYAGMSRLLAWSIADGQPKHAAGAFFAVGSLLALCGVLVFEATPNPPLALDHTTAE